MRGSVSDPSRLVSVPRVAIVPVPYFFGAGT